MEKLNELRDYLKAHDGLIDASKVLVWSENGTFDFQRTDPIDPDYNFTTKQTIYVFIGDYVGDVNVVHLMILRWINDNVPSLKDNDLSFESDALDDEKFDLTYRFPLKNQVQVTVRDGNFKIDGLDLADVLKVPS